MKKLMIMAAVAASVIGSYAVPTYDLTITLKTTSAKYGKQTTTYTVNLGLDDTGVYWWDVLGFADATEAKNYVKSLSNDEKADFAYTYLGFDGVSTKFNNKEMYRGKWVWCYTFKFTIADENCYRVAGSRKIKATVVVDDCCSLTNKWRLTDESYAENSEFLADQEITTLFLAKFGGLLDNKAKQIEFAGEIGDFSTHTFGNWSLAGQGKWNTKLDVLDSISGNIVGFLPGPMCESCCGPNLDALCFTCDTDGNIIAPTYGAPTVAYGTWTLKYNAKKSN